MDCSWDGYSNRGPIADVLADAEKQAAAAEPGTEAWAEPLVWAALWQARDLGEQNLNHEAVSKLDALRHRNPSPLDAADIHTRRHYWVRLGHNYRHALLHEEAIAAYNHTIAISEQEWNWSWRTPECMAYIAHVLVDQERYDLARRTATAALDYLRKNCAETLNEKDTWADVLAVLERIARQAGDEAEAERWAETGRNLREDPASVIQPRGPAAEDDDFVTLPPLHTVLEGLDSQYANLPELLRRVEARCITEPPNSLWHAMRHLISARAAKDAHTRFAHLRNAVDAAWPYGASPLLIEILENAASTAAELEAWGAEESYLESMLDVQQRSFGENSAEHLRARFRLAVCHSRRYDVRGCRQELLRLRKLVLTRYPDDAGFDQEIGTELARLAGPEEAEALETLDRRAALDEALRELQAMIGLTEVKRHIARLVAFLAVSRERERAGLPRVQRGFHFVFLGPPGTGKTTVARLIGRIFWALELLPTDTLVEAGRVDLVGGYIGQTAIKTEELVKRALDGVLFVDEAYALQGESGNDFGHEAVAELIKHMENDRERFVVILAGYTREMEHMLEMNPGLASRVNEQLYFPAYDDAELEQIFRSFCAQQRYELSAAAERRLPEVIKEMRRTAGKTFGNAREIRNLFEDAVVLQASRLHGVRDRDEAMLGTLEAEDLAGVGTARPSARTIGFTG